MPSVLRRRVLTRVEAVLIYQFLLLLHHPLEIAARQTLHGTGPWTEAKPQGAMNQLQKFTVKTIPRGLEDGP